MPGTFLPSIEVEREHLSWGTLGWMSRPATTGANQLVVIEVDLSPGHGHDFHVHPDQEEVLYVVAGEVEQWIERDRRRLRPGDSVFIPKGIVHASFNVSNAPAKFVAILGPCVSDAGYVSVEVGGEEPWKSLRAHKSA